ncbi:MAG: hypothetical protein RSA29_03610 [Clostridium sp.]|uniref:hypothetical protein n=1 Tax=Clostridium sp. TaxID=1506 RepID=UPI0030316265
MDDWFTIENIDKEPVHKISYLNVLKILPYYYELDVCIGLIREVNRAFNETHSHGNLKQGNGGLDIRILVFIFNQITY